jgi:hypothetical protein
MKINVPYISFPKFFLYFTLVFFAYLGIGMLLDLPEAEKNSQIDYINRSTEAIEDVNNQVRVISKKLKDNDY